jgi:CheY-like chemotaxis protein
MADDDDDDCILAKDAFKESGANGAIHCVENGIELMDYLHGSGRPPALILLDLNMPRKDGRQALREIKSFPALQTIPVVVLTTSREEKDVAYCREMGANSFITKPTAFSEWVKMMKSLTDRYLAA